MSPYITFTTTNKCCILHKKTSSHFDSLYTVWQYPKHSYSICGQLRSLPKILFAQITSYWCRFLKICEIKSVNSRTPLCHIWTPELKPILLTSDTGIFHEKRGTRVQPKGLNGLLGTYNKHGRHLLHGQITRGHFLHGSVTRGQLSYCPFNCTIPNDCGGWNNGVSWILSFLNE